jgi:formylglycine-generating enzyme required for sulfatase activity
MTASARPPTCRQGMLGFYIVSLAGVALAVFGGWFWAAWDNWQFGKAEAQRRQAEAAAQLSVPVETAVDLGDGVKLELVLIPPGMFDMGSPDSEVGRWNDMEKPVHRVRISRAFYMGKYEVTQEQWQKVMGTNPSYFEGATLPVQDVSWDDCQEFLAKLNALGNARRPFRLPTEAEWEWACRAGTKMRFCFGGDDARLGEYAWYKANSGGRVHPVGEKQPNAWGLHDCHGNVSEWCSDWYGAYPANTWSSKFRWTPDPQGTPSGLGRMVRGGSWINAPKVCLSAGRWTCVFSDGTSGRMFNLGFRIAIAAMKP